jgi:hypothetical protein
MNVLTSFDSDREGRKVEARENPTYSATARFGETIR